MAAKKPKTTAKQPRLVGRGAVVMFKGAPETVRSVSIVLHLANGQDMSLDPGESVDVIDDPDPTLLAAYEAIENGGLVIDAPSPRA